MGIFNFVSDSKPKGMIRALELHNWYASITHDQRQKLLQYFGNENLLTSDILHTSQSQKGFFNSAASCAFSEGDSTFGKYLSKCGFDAKGTLADQHFIFNTLIDASVRAGNLEEAKSYCLREIDMFENIRASLKKDLGIVPPSIPCRDSLIYILKEMGCSFEEFSMYLDIMVQKKLLTKKAAREEILEFEVAYLLSEAERCLKENDAGKAEELYKQAIKKDKSQSSQAYKSLGDYFYDKNDGELAIKYYDKAIKAEPGIGGIKRKMNRLEKRLGKKTSVTKEDIRNALEEKCINANDWWQKRELAKEFSKIMEYDRAWGLFNEAIVLRSQGGGYCDTIYPDMAKMREREKNFKHALLLYLIAYKERLRGNDDTIPKYLSQGVKRCLKNLGASHIKLEEIASIVRSEKNPRLIQEKLNEMLLSG